jgi:hypothetical protein
MRKSFLLVAALALGALRPSAAPATPVVVELFTSEGCESCPPADVLLQQLASTQPVAGAQIIPLSLHVDYWDQLGWKDRFSSAALTSRQRIYGARFNADDIYTPQMVVDGRSAFVGSDGAAARRTIEQASSRAHGSIVLQIRVGGFEKELANKAAATVIVQSLPPHADPVDVVIAVTEDRIQSKVTAGENHGRTLTHTAVVHDLVTLRDAPDSPVRTVTTALRIDPTWKRQDLRVVAFVQERRGGAILASTVTALERP